MTGPYPGTTYNENPQASQLTGAEIVPLLQSGRNRWTTVTSFISTITGIATGITQLTAGSGLAGGTVTTVGTFTVDIGSGLAFSGNQLIATGGGNSGSVSSVAAVITGSGISVTGSPITSAGTFTFSAVNDLGAVENISTTGYAIRTANDAWIARPLSSVVNRIDLTNSAGIAGNTVIDISASYTGQATINTVGTLTSGIWNGTPINFANLQSASPSVLIGNPTGVTGVPTQITLGANLSFSGTSLVAAGSSGGGAGTVTNIISGSGLTGGPITNTGTLSVVLGSGLAFSGNQIINTSGSGSSSGGTSLGLVYAFAAGNLVC